MLLGASRVSAFRSGGLSRAVATNRGVRAPGALARLLPPRGGGRFVRLAVTAAEPAPCRPPSVVGEDGQLATTYAPSALRRLCGIDRDSEKLCCEDLSLECAVPPGGGRPFHAWRATTIHFIL